MPSDPLPPSALIDRLVHDLKPVRRRSTLGDAVIIGLLALIELGLFLALGMMRPDMSAAMEQPSFWWKLASMGLIAGVGGAITVLSFDPVRSPRRGLRWLGGLIVVCLMGGWLIDAARNGWPDLVARLDWENGVQCVYKMALLSAPAVIGLGVLMRRGAPTDTRGTAAVVGLTAAAWGAFVFVFACPYDDPLYIAVWYSVGCGLVTLAARIVLPPLTRW